MLLLDGEVCLGWISSQCCSDWRRPTVHMGWRWPRSTWWVLLPGLYL